MARPVTKIDLLTSAEEEYNKLITLIDGMSEKQQKTSFMFEDRDKNIRDVLIHLYEWHQLALQWIKQNMTGHPQPFLPAPYNWRTYPKMNIEFWEKHQQTSLEEAKNLLHNSHQEILLVIDSFSNEALFTKKFFSWSGNTNIGTYLVSSTSSHYVWAQKKIRKHKKSLV